MVIESTLSLNVSSRSVSDNRTVRPQQILLRPGGPAGFLLGGAHWGLKAGKIRLTAITGVN
jgi:hypothetical protein